MVDNNINQGNKRISPPFFLGIGAPKCGSTWLQHLLDSHPQIFIPKERNEIHYFDRYIQNKGVDWYLNFFSSASDKMLSGEITPHYLYINNPSEVKSLGVEKLLLIIRNPIDRVISHYKFRIRVDNYKGDFSNFIKDYPESIEWGFYSKYINNWLSFYSKKDLCIFVFEDAVKNVEETKKKLGDFLEIDSSLFPEKSGERKINEGFVPKFPTLYNSILKVSTFFLKKDLYVIRNKAKKIIKKTLSKKSDTSAIVITQKDREMLEAIYADELKKMRENYDVFFT